MKTHLKMLFVAMLCLGWINYVKAQLILNGKEIDTTVNHQMNFVFGNLDKSHVPNGLLRDYAIEFTNLKSYDGTVVADSTLMNKRIFFELYKTLATSRVTTTAYTTLPDPDVVDSTWFIQRTPGTVALAGLFYQYAYLDATALDNNKITVNGGQYFDKFIGGVYQSPYLTGMTLGFAPATEAYLGQSFNILLPGSLWLSNSKSLVNHIEVDAGDGQGYQTINPDIPLPINYADTGLKIWNFKLFLTNGTVLQSHTRLQVTEDTYGQNIPQSTDVDLFTAGVTRLSSPSKHGGLSPFGVTLGPPPPVGSAFYYVESSETFGGIPAFGFATVQYAAGHTNIQKPLIVVEGFDPGFYLSPDTRTGWYSLKAFNNAVANSLSSNLKNLLSGQTSTYDIIYIDYKNGTDDIRRNALLVKEVIRWVNSEKALNGSTEKNVVLGLSMGGVVARYALKKMEDAGENHDTRLFVNHDGPQQGANVPAGYQFMINHAKNLYARAGFGVATYTFINLLATGNGPWNGLALGQSMASKQMIINYIDDSNSIDNSVHNAWQTELTNLGYPANCRNVAISNGSECGQPQGVQSGGLLFNITGNYKTSFLGDLATMVATPIAGPFLVFFTGQPALLLGVLPGANTITMNFQVNAANANGGNQAYHGDITYHKKLLWLFNISVAMTNKTVNAPSALSYDTFGGGFFHFDKINNISGSVPALLSYNISFTGPINFCGVPTPSVLDLGSSPTALTGPDYLKPYGFANAPVSPKNTPFANFITARDGVTGAANDEEHITYETRNGNWLAAELNNAPTVVDCSLTCSPRTITGPTHFCGATPVVYSIAGVPANANITWSVSGSAVINGTSTGNQISVSSTTPFGQQGFVAITAVLHSTCGDVTLVKNNVPTGTLDLPPIDGPSEICILDHGNHYTVDAPEATGLPTWTMSPAPIDFHTFTGPQLDLRTSHPGNYFLIVTVPTACGNEQQSMAITVDPCLPEPSFVAFPNPAGSTMTITSSGKTASSANLSAADVASSKAPFTYKIYDDKGKVWSEGSSEKGDDIDVDVRGMPNKTYFLHITVGKKTIIKQIIVQH